MDMERVLIVASNEITESNIEMIDIPSEVFVIRSTPIIETTYIDIRDLNKMWYDRFYNKKKKY